MVWFGANRQLISKISIERAAAFISLVAKEQAPFLTDQFFAHGKKHALGYFYEGELVGVIALCVQVIGEEQGTPPIIVCGQPLFEAKVIAFAVKEQARNKGIGKALQQEAMEFAESQGCFQLASYSTFDKVENYRVKSALGFSIQPEVQPDGTMGCYFLKTL